MGVLYVPLISCKIFINDTKISGGIMTDRTRHEIDLIDSSNKDKSYQEKKDKESLIDEIISICKANKDNTYCSKYQLTDMIKQTFKLYDIHD